MSSVNSNSGTSGVDERVRKSRDDYKKREADLIKKHNREIKELNDKYVGQLDKKDASQTQSLNYAREKSSEALTSRDVKYHKEMEEMRDLHTKQLERLMQENRERVKAQSEASRLEVKQVNLGKSDRVGELHSRYENQYGQQQEKFTNALDDLRQDQKEEITKNREKLNKKHEDEIESLREHRDESIAKLKNDYRTLSRSSDQRLRNQEIRHLQTKMRQDASNMNNIQLETEAHNRQQELSRDGFEVGLKSVRDDMTRARENDVDAQNEIYGQFKNDVQDRVASRVNRLEQDVQKARNQTIKDRVDADLSAKKQVSNIKNAYQDKFDYLEKARIETLRQSNQINSQNITKVSDAKDNQMAENTRFYIDKNTMDNIKNRDHIDSLEKNHKLSEEYNKTNAESRIENVVDYSHQNEAKLADNYKQNLDIMKFGNQEEKKELVISQLKEKNRNESQFKDFMHRQEVTHQRKSEETVSKYEKRIAEMNEQFMREKKLRDAKEKSLVNELKRRHDGEIEAMRIKYDDQNRQTAMNHERQLRDNQRRNSEKLNEVLVSVKKT